MRRLVSGTGTGPNTLRIRAPLGCTPWTLGDGRAQVQSKLFMAAIRFSAARLSETNPQNLGTKVENVRPGPDQVLP
jgi:hypothetical protein